MKMPVHFSRVEPALAHAARGGVVVTSNTRASRFLRRAAAAQARQQGRAAWRVPDILHWDAWVLRLWQERLLRGGEDRIVLSTAQERVAWESIGGQTGPASSDRLCALAQSAWGLLWRYAGGPQALARQSGSGEWVRFAESAAEFYACLEQNQWVTQAQLPELLARELDRGVSTAIPPVLLAAFDRLTPAQERLRAALARHTVVTEFVPSYADVNPAISADGHAGKLCLPDISRSIEAAAWWARRRVEAATDAGHEAHLAVVAPSVSSVRGEIQRVFSRVLGEGAFQFSLGAPLASASLAATALLLLRWLAAPLPLGEITTVLLSPCAGQRDGDSASLRARLDVALRADCRLTLPEYSLREFAKELNLRSRDTGQPFVPLRELATQATRASRLANTFNTESPTELPSWWAARFSEYLAAWHLSPPAGTDSRGWQAWQSWEGLLETLAQMDFAGEPRGLEWILNTVERLARETVFQPAAAEVPVEILGPLEAAGSLFDGMFFLGADADSWPQGGSPHPLLPLALQRETAMPHGSHANDHAAAEEVTRRLQRTSGEAVFSWPARSNDGVLLPSPLLQTLQPLPETYAGILLSQQELCQDGTKFWPDSDPLAWETERGALRAATLEQQAACPFQAFAASRLAANDLENPEDGPDARERGNLLHRLLENIWRGNGELPGLRDSATLRELRSSGGLDAFILSHAEALPRKGGHGRWQDAFHALELERITGRVRLWLEQEDKRASFETLRAEQAVAFEMEGLPFSLKLDRIDVLLPDDEAEARLVLLDYKTGNIAGITRKGQLEKPQLPLYAYSLAHGDIPLDELGEGRAARVAAVAFGSLKPGEIKFSGAAESSDTDILPGVKTSDLQNKTFPTWNEELQRLSREFASGYSRVDPAKGSGTCRYCAFPGLCRVAEAREVQALEGLDLEGGPDYA